MLSGALILAMAIGTIQGQADDNSPFVWISIDTKMDAEQGCFQVFLGKVNAISIDGNSAGAREDWEEFSCLLNGGFVLFSTHFCFFAELQITQGEDGENNVSFFGRAILSVDEGEDVVRVSTCTYKIESHKS